MIKALSIRRVKSIRVHGSFASVPPPCVRLVASQATSCSLYQRLCLIRPTYQRGGVQLRFASPVRMSAKLGMIAFYPSYCNLCLSATFK